MSSRSDDQMGALVAELFVLTILISAWLLSKTFELVARVLVRHPDCRPVWAALAVFVLTFTAMVATNGRYETLDACALVSLVLLAMVAKVAELYYDNLLQQEVRKEVVIDQVLHAPWFSLAAS